MSDQATAVDLKKELEGFLRAKGDSSERPPSLEWALAFLQFIAVRLKPSEKVPKILVPGEKAFEPKGYEEKRRIANPKFQFRPAAILICQADAHVQFGIELAKALNLELRVRSGGHDHEGECSGTDAIVIDFTESKKIEIDEKAGVLVVGPGVQFQELVPKLNENEVGIPHGTCGSVGIAGFMFGGGWGPWTRQKGMGCESLVGATIVLGDGTIKNLSDQDEAEESRSLLWALRGGGGMSYGIVTELRIKTFPLPEKTFVFHAVWDNSPALRVLELWEGLIAPDQNEKLIGTNLMIKAKPSRPKGEPIEESVHQCTFFGCYAGTQEELDRDMDRWFANLRPSQIDVTDNEGTEDLRNFALWDRIPNYPNYQEENKDEEDLELLILPDEEKPAPHKITSRLVQTEGLGDEGRRTLIKSLESDLLSEKGEEAGINCYVTLGAISGLYYRDYKPDPVGSAFPYKDRPYTIQYQAWWDEDKSDENQEPHHREASKATPYSNAAEDWIEESRQRKFPQTQGAFISFKDSAVPTEEYFLGSYERLKEIKQKYSCDKDNLFRTRKTIV